jgi:hypothetical protein
MRKLQLRDYLFGLLVFAGAVAARFLFDQLVPNRFPFIFGVGPGPPLIPG